MTNSKSEKPRCYDQARALAAVVAKEMVGRLPWLLSTPKHVLDIGCGSQAVVISEHFPDAAVIGVDSDLSMLQFQPSTNLKLNAKAEQLPCLANSIDLIFANLVLPWCKDLTVIFDEWMPILRPDGAILFSALGPDTLSAWQSSLGNSMLPNLMDMHVIGDAMLAAGFTNTVMDVDHYTLEYQTHQAMLAELTASQFLIDAEKQETTLTTNDVSPPKALFEVVYGYGMKPLNAQGFRADSEGTVHIPLTSLHKNKVNKA